MTEGQLFGWFDVVVAKYSNMVNCLRDMCKANNLCVSVNCCGMLNSQTKVRSDAKFHQRCRLETTNVLNCTS